MPKILLATTELNRIGGMASHLQHTAAGLKKRGWEVHCMASNVRGDFFEEMNKNFTCYDFSSVPLSPNKVFMAADLVNSIAPDIVMLNNCALMNYALPLIDPFAKPVAVLHSDDSRFYAIASLFPNRIFRWIAPTVGVRTQFHRFIPRELYGKVHVIPHGTDHQEFFSRDDEKRIDGFQILFVGFLGESKGADLLPSIFEKVASDIPNAFLTIVGDGPLRMNLDAEFEKLGLKKRVTMCGLTPPAQTAEIMRRSHLLLLPTNLEGFGMVLVEAMMSGLVPVASRLRGITDQIVDHAETGFLVTPGDIHGFAEAIKTIHNDENLFRAMSQKARAVAADRFSLDSMIDRYEELFGEPDDRQNTRKSPRPGWYAEAAIQFLRKRLK